MSRRAAGMRLSLVGFVLPAAAATAIAQEPPLLPGANPPIHGPSGSSGTDLVKLYRVHFRPDPFCGQTWAEVPRPVEIDKWNMSDIGDEIGKKDYVDALFKGVATIDEVGKVSDIQLTSVWATGGQYAETFRDVSKEWQFKPGLPGKVCVELAVDVSGEIGAMFEEPKRAAPKPSVATEIPYPELAYERAVSGSVTLSIDINRDSRVTAVYVINEDPVGYAFGVSAAETVKAEWRFDGAQAGRYRLKLKFAR